MRIVHLVPGSGGTFYCQNCVRDRGLVRALRRTGHEVILMPLYLPMFDEAQAPAANAPLFFGGIHSYLRERLPLFRYLPNWAIRLLDHRSLLQWAAKQEGSTNAADLGPMTISMLQGAQGKQGAEFRRMLDWLKGQEPPDIVHISNALLLGFAPEIKKALGATIFCSLQDEEPWVDAMHPPYDRLCWEKMAENAGAVDHFIATSEWYRNRMIDRLHLPQEKISVLFPGVESDEPAAGGLPFHPPVIGYLSRLNPAQGLETLIDAFLTIRKTPELAALRLVATGGYTPADKPFLDRLRKRLEEAGAQASVDFIENFTEAKRHEFLRSLTLLSVPAPDGEAFGLQLLESMACGVPVAQPAVGAYPEIVAATGGGRIYDPNQPDGLVKTLHHLLTHPEETRALGKQGRAVVLEKFHTDAVAQAMLDRYEASRKEALL